MRNIQIQGVAGNAATDPSATIPAPARHPAAVPAAAAAAVAAPAIPAATAAVKINIILSAAIAAAAVAVATAASKPRRSQHLHPRRMHRPSRGSNNNSLNSAPSGTVPNEAAAMGRSSDSSRGSSTTKTTQAERASAVESVSETEKESEETAANVCVSGIENVNANVISSVVDVTGNGSGNGNAIAVAVGVAATSAGSATIVAPPRAADAGKSANLKI